MKTEELKHAAGEAAAEHVREGMRVGLGSGTTAHEFVKSLGRRVNQGLRISAVASSQATAELAERCGIPLVEHDAPLDLAVDGADAVARGSLAAIKGLGGALVRERLVASAASQFILVVDEAKLFATLDESQPSIPVPVEILRFGWKVTSRRLSGFGRPELRVHPDGAPYQTDNGNIIVDLYSCDLTVPDRLATSIKSLPGIVDHGLFLNLATSAIVATPGGIVRLEAN